MRYAKPQSAQPEATGPTVSEGEIELVNYIFHKVCETWGQKLYELHIGDEGALKIKKRDWAKDLLSAVNCKRQNRETEGEWLFRAKSKIDRVFTEIRHYAEQPDRRDQWRFPDLRRVCAALANHVVPPEHKPFRRDRALEDKSKTEAAKAAGARELAKMRAALGMSKFQPKPGTSCGDLLS